MKPTRAQLEKALELAILDHINDGPQHYCRSICKEDYCSPAKNGKCVKKMAEHFLSLAKGEKK